MPKTPGWPSSANGAPTPNPGWPSSANDGVLFSQSRTAPCGNGLCDGACRVCDPPHPCRYCGRLTRNDDGVCRRCEDGYDE